MPRSRAVLSVVVALLVAVACAGCSSSSDGSGGTTSGTDPGDGGSSSSGSTSDSGSSGGGDDDGAGERPDVNGITAAHNAARADVSPVASPAIPALTWSSTVAAAAQSWADGCSFAHGGTGSYGQNIFASTGSTAPADVVASWVAESASYDHASNTCASGETCGHYTQVVWRDSTQLGCGVTTCTTGSPFGSGSWQLWVCDYDPPGNFVGQTPY